MSRRAAGLRLPLRGAGTFLAGVATTVGLLVSSALVAVVFAGVLQWVHRVPPWLDNALPLTVLAGGMALAGRAAVDVAGRLGTWASVVAAAFVGLFGLVLADNSEAHGDGIEPVQVALATLAVLVLTSGTAVLVRRARGA